MSKYPWLICLIGAINMGAPAVQAAPIEMAFPLGSQPSLQRKLDLIAAPIKSKADLDRHMEVSAIIDSPINRLSPLARKRFLATLVFNENGLVSYGYADLVAELGAADIYQLMALFGAQRTVALIKGLHIGSGEDAAVAQLKP